MKQLQLLFVFVGIWFVASFINGLISGICLGINDSDFFGVAFVCSFIFSVPLVGLVWFAAALAVFNGVKEFKLFRFIVITTFIVSLAGCIAFIAIFSKDFGDVCFIAGAAVIFSAITSVLLFRKQFKTYGNTSLKGETKNILYEYTTD